jgi:pimeloyl-ACP methyl ester carboxylesterase
VPDAMSTETMAPQLRLRDATDAPAWSATGEGTALLLIAGIGLDGNSWWRSIPGFAERFRVITFDYRGVGRSGPAPLFCSTDDLANDAVAVLDEAGVESGFVYGFSLGGMVAQRLALRHPDRVSALVLGPPRQAGPTRFSHGWKRLRTSGERGSYPAQPPPRPPSPTSTGSAVAAKPRNASPLTWSSDSSDGSTPRLIGDTSSQQ